MACCQEEFRLVYPGLTVNLTHDSPLIKSSFSFWGSRGSVALFMHSHDPLVLSYAGLVGITTKPQLTS